ncbi:MAG TPA: selenium-dependent molybdenum cofactor biosynthesis protein YqeB [Rectinemataceae bacterium]|nr:selenium-dependent molybdenum cofactor biosynthesis protein YqeB [Rectinemataceae bacterium]
MFSAAQFLEWILSERGEGAVGSLNRGGPSREAVVVSFVGAGGKTEAIFALAGEARRRGLAVIVTTTTAMRDPRLELGRRLDLFLEELPKGPLPKATASFLSLLPGEGSKLRGVKAEELPTLRSLCDLILVEADGSRGLPIKAPAAHEPVIPPSSDCVVACLGLDAFGLPADDSRVHRLDEFLACTGLEKGRPIDEAAIARLAAQPAGSFKGSPPASRRALLLCKADCFPPAMVAGLAASLSSALLGRGAHDRSLDLVAALGLGGARTFVLLRGAGDLASGVIVRLRRAGFLVGALEGEAPSAIRRSVSFSEAVYAGRIVVEGLAARRVADAEEFYRLLLAGEEIPILVDPEGSAIPALGPSVLVDAIMAKKNLGTRIAMAPLVIALGPGFVAGRDVHAVVETNRGHELARVLWEGQAEADTGLPGEIGGASGDRVLHAEVEGWLKPLEVIGAQVSKNQVIAYIESNKEHFNVYSKLDGILRGILPDGYPVTRGFKIADVDPRARPEHCHRVSDKSRAIGGGVLEAILAGGFAPHGEASGIRSQ